MDAYYGFAWQKRSDRRNQHCAESPQSQYCLSSLRSLYKSVGLNAIVLTSYDRGKTWEPQALFRLDLAAMKNGRGQANVCRSILTLRIFFFWEQTKKVCGKTTDGATSFTKVAAFPNPAIMFVLFDEHSGQYGSPTPTIYVGVNVTTDRVFIKALTAASPGQPCPVSRHRYPGQ